MDRIFSGRHRLFLRRAGPRIIFSRRWPWRRAASATFISTRGTLWVVDRRRAQPDKERSRSHADQQEWIALRYGSLGDRKTTTIRSGCTWPAAWCALPVPSWTRGLPPWTKYRYELPIQVTVFDSSDGVRSLSIQQLSSPGRQDPDGKLWFLPWDGVSVIDPHHLPFNKLPPPVHIEQITADGKTYDAASERANLRLPPRIRDLAIDYTALSLVAPEKMRFRYKLEG